MKNKIIAAILIVTPHLAAAQDNNSAHCSTGYTVFFGNGVRTDPTKADKNTRRTEALLGSNYNDKTINYQTSYNPTDGLLLDLLEVFEQKREEDPSLNWSLFFRWVSGQAINTSLAIALTDYFGNDGADKIRDTSARLTSPSSYSDPTVIKHTQTYESELLAGKRVMLVAHSQGNLYANAVKGALDRKNSSAYDVAAFGITAVASPANGVATADRYVTSDSDLVIDAVRIVQPLTLPANNPSVPLFPSEDRLGHGYHEIYLTDKYINLRNHVLSAMNSTLGRLSNVTTTNTAGPITATLTWNRSADLDLHSYEPSGLHVYYANRTGNVGYLDRDDIQGTGPEHYYTTCENFVEGKYSFGINYFSGEGSRIGVLKMSVLGVNYPAKSIVLNTPENAAGNANPSILFRVDVSKDKNGRYQANVY